MAVVLRIIAVLMGVVALVPFLFLAWHLGEITLVQSNVMRTIAGLLILAVLLAFVALGIFAMVRLWQLRQAGRKASAGIFAILLALQIAGMVSGDAPLSWVLLLCPVVLAVLLSPQARRACSI